MKKIKFWNSEKIVSIIAIIIGVGSLIVVTYQTNLIRNQTELIQREQRISVMPYLRFGFRTINPERVETYLVNSGLGPALIKEVKIHTEEKDYEIDLAAFFTGSYDYNGVYLTLNAIEIGDLIPAGSDITLIGANPKDSAFTEFITLFELEKAVFEITYASLYGEKWLLSSLENVPVQLKKE